MRQRRAGWMLALLGTAALGFTSCGGSGSSGPPPPSEFTIGGTVAGLAGSGLVLVNNGANNLAIIANGSFVFTAQVLQGASYNVTVLTQPSGPVQNCAVANGNGTVTSNVTSVQVTCTTLYTIGGTVSGLSGTGLVLQDNGGDSLSIGANGSFTFATPVASGSSYAVTVLTQPANPAQKCVVANPSGVASANVTNVQITCTTTPTYTIGGTVSGLQASTNVVLLDNGTNNLPLSANGSFTFTTPILGGSNYNVTVLTQPANAKCTVANGSGTANGNVTNVLVTCASKLKVLYTFGTQPNDGSDSLASLVFDSKGNLYGTTLSGGANGGGTVFEVPTPLGQGGEKVLYSFCQLANCADGGAPHASLVLDSAGNLYGTASEGGVNQGGVVFELSQQNGTWTETVLHTFAGSGDGVNPQGGVVFDSAGNLYGTTVGGGANSKGTLYELSPSGGSWTETILYSFCSQTQCTDGSGPIGNLVFDAAGNLYGETNTGGAASPDQAGTVFQLSPAGGGEWTETVLYAFVNNGGFDGNTPTGGLAMTTVDSSLVLFGTTEFGGQYGNAGLLFKVGQGTVNGNPAWIESQVYSFCGESPCSGYEPNGGLVLDSAGNIYGTTPLGGASNVGVVYMVAGETATTLYSFEGGSDGYSPGAGVILDQAGNLYGTSQTNPPNGGVVFEVTP
jgi:uncharacterized repeat protein (TIGR03803 family)